MQIELRKMDDTGDGISIAALKEFGKHHQALLYPVFKLQHHMQENVLGVAFWRKASNRRVELCKGKYVTMSDLLYLVRKVIYFPLQLDLPTTTYFSTSTKACTSVLSRTRRTSTPKPRCW